MAKMKGLEKYNPIEFGLTPGQKAFVDEYLIDLNHIEAQQRLHPEWSRQRCSRQAKYMLGKPAVQEAIEYYMSKRIAKREIKAEMIMEELARVAFQDIRNVVSFNEQGVTFKRSEELDDDTARSISEISETVTQHGGTKRVKMYDKLAALELLGRHLGMWKDRVEHSGGMVILDGSRKRDG